MRCSMCLTISLTTSIVQDFQELTHWIGCRTGPCHFEHSWVQVSNYSRKRKLSHQPLKDIKCASRLWLTMMYHFTKWNNHVMWWENRNVKLAKHLFQGKHIMYLRSLVKSLAKDLLLITKCTSMMAWLKLAYVELKISFKGKKERKEKGVQYHKSTKQLTGKY